MHSFGIEYQAKSLVTRDADPSLSHLDLLLRQGSRHSTTIFSWVAMTPNRGNSEPDDVHFRPLNNKSQKHRCIQQRYSKTPYIAPRSRGSGVDPTPKVREFPGDAVWGGRVHLAVNTSHSFHSDNYTDSQRASNKSQSKCASYLPRLWLLGWVSLAQPLDTTFNWRLTRGSVFTKNYTRATRWQSHSKWATENLAVLPTLTLISS